MMDRQMTEMTEDSSPAQMEALKPRLGPVRGGGHLLEEMGVRGAQRKRQS